MTHTQTPSPDVFPFMKAVFVTLRPCKKTLSLCMVSLSLCKMTVSPRKVVLRPFIVTKAAENPEHQLINQGENYGSETCTRRHRFQPFDRPSD